MKTGNTECIPNCARGPLHLRRAAIIFWNPFLSFYSLAYPEIPSEIFPPFVLLYIFRSPYSVAKNNTWFADRQPNNTIRFVTCKTKLSARQLALLRYFEISASIEYRWYLPPGFLDAMYKRRQDCCIESRKSFSINGLYSIVNAAPLVTAVTS